MKIQKKIINAFTAGTLDEVQRIFAEEFDFPGLDDAIRVYLQINDSMIMLFRQKYSCLRFGVIGDMAYKASKKFAKEGNVTATLSWIA